MTIKTVTLSNFRCFTSATFECSPRLTIIHGENGSGKTSLLEAIHYSCYFKSFRTHTPFDLAFDGKCNKNDAQVAIPGFSIKIVTSNNDDIALGVCGRRRSYKINGVPVKDYRQIAQQYRVVTFMEDDLSLIKGYPEERRSFLDQALCLIEESYFTHLRRARKNNYQRNTLLQKRYVNPQEYQVWVESFLEENKKIISHRKNYIERLSVYFDEVCAAYGTENFLHISYKEKGFPYSYNFQSLSQLVNEEIRAAKILYGFHLDDLDITLHQRSSRAFASRGQQKLAILLLKIAQTRLLMSDSSSLRDSRLVFLLDDFLTDFDQIRIKKVLSLLFTLDVQLLITVPQTLPLLNEMCSILLADGDFSCIVL